MHVIANGNEEERECMLTRTRTIQEFDCTWSYTLAIATLFYMSKLEIGTVDFRKTSRNITNMLKKNNIAHYYSAPTGAKEGGQ